MSSPALATAHPPAQAVVPPIWGQLPLLCAGGGGALALLGAFVNTQQFAHSYLVAFMFFLSLCLGGLFLTIIHHLFDASWSVPVRRVNEHLAFLLPIMGLLFLPIAILAAAKTGDGHAVLFQWMHNDPHTDHALHAKQPIFTMAGFYGIAVLLFAVWTLLSWNLRRHSLAQDKTGAASCTFKMRFHAAYGIYVFALTLTLAAIMWMKGLEHQWFSTMYGVYYFAASVWMTLATLYLIVNALDRTGPLHGVIHRRQYHDIGVLLFAFTVFYAYIHFSQYFLIYNANIPEETFWYVKREQGSWWGIGMILVFGHFLFPFLALLRIDSKLNLTLMLPLVIWVWICHYCDMQFNIMPVIHPGGFSPHWMDVACLAFIGGTLAIVFLKYFKAHPPYPLKDPRLGEALGVHEQGVRPPIAAHE